MIRRVISCFFLFEERKVAVFHRQSSMPTFPDHWATISGSIESNETPSEAAHRELEEETNLMQVLSDMNESISNLSFGQGLYVDVPYAGQRTEHERTFGQIKLCDYVDHSDLSSRFQHGDIIRVYPFVLEVPCQVYQSLQLRGGEHDEMKWITLEELESLSPTVPALVTAFHHATTGKYIPNTPVNVREWASDCINGAATLAKRALQVVRDGGSPATMKMMRPSMVPIINVLEKVELIEKEQSILLAELETSLERETERAVELAVSRITAQVEHRKGDSFAIGVFSRSSTLSAILKRIEEMHSHVQIVCSQSTPGDEGVLMAEDLRRAKCITDSQMLESVKNGDVHLVLVGCDCVTSGYVVNKIGTFDLAKATQGSCPIYCCSDRWKIWDDIFPPPLESVFEQIPRSFFDDMLLPSSL